MPTHDATASASGEADGPGRSLPVDYDRDPHRFAANQEATKHFSAQGDVHAGIAHRLADAGCRSVVDIGGGNGALSRHLVAQGIQAVVVDPASYVATAPGQPVLANALRLPFADETFDAAAAVWMLYHLDDPVAALREAHRVVRPGGWLAVATPSRHNDPETADAFPDFGTPLSFDAENGVELLSRVFQVVEVERWDEPIVHLPDREALALYLRGRGLTEQDAAAAAGRLDVPMTVTKRGMVAWCRKAGSEQE